MIEYPELEQGSEEWRQARCGIITASTVGNLITSERPAPTEVACVDCESTPGNPCNDLRNGKAMKGVHSARTALAATMPSRLVTADNDTSRGLILTLAAERITGRVEDSYTTFDMQRGHDEEPWARDAYAENYAPVTELGFCTEDRWGFTLGVSPDGLVHADGGIEIKSRRQKNHVAIVLADEVPPQHMPQIQTFLLVTGRKWCDYVDFSNGMHLFRKRVWPDEQWFNAITDAAMAAEEAIRDICARYDMAVANLPATERIVIIDLMGQPA